MIIAWRNRADLADLLADSSEPKAPVWNLKHPHLSRRYWTADGRTSCIIDIHFAQPEECAAIAVEGTNLSSSATYRLTAIGVAGEGGGSSLLISEGFGGDSSALILGGFATAEGEAADSVIVQGAVIRDGWDPPITAQDWRLEITDAMPADDHLELGRLFLGPGWIPRDNDGRMLGPSFGWTIVDQDNSRPFRAFGGQVFIERRPKTNGMSLSISYLGRDEMAANAYAMQSEVGIHSDVLMILRLDTKAHRGVESIYGTVVDTRVIEKERPDHYKYSIEVVQRL